MDLRSCCWRLRGTRELLFLGGGSFPPDWPVFCESFIKLSVYDVKESGEQQSSFLGSTSFSLADLFQSRDQQLSLNLRSTRVSSLHWSGGMRIFTV
nr:type II inositol 3,4-bisphosphate 4-phosphatase-like [Misgurnus anguillicaudatus]